MARFQEENGFKFAVTRPYFTVEKKERARVGSCRITVNPYTCKGCMECVEVCDDDALRPVPQTDASVEEAAGALGFWLDLPTTPQAVRPHRQPRGGHRRAGDHPARQERTTWLRQRRRRLPRLRREDLVHLFTATVEALMRPRVEAREGARRSSSGGWRSTSSSG
jgi:pyruvate-ferredoxin/flavodoxin oxidoreductase